MRCRRGQQRACLAKLRAVATNRVPSALRTQLRRAQIILALVELVTQHVPAAQRTLDDLWAQAHGGARQAPDASATQLCKEIRHFQWQQKKCCLSLTGRIAACVNDSNVPEEQYAYRLGARLPLALA